MSPGRPVGWVSGLSAYVGTAAVLAALDFIWLRFIALDHYRQGIAHLMAAEVDYVAGGLFYLLFPIGLMLFVVWPQLSLPRWRTAACGALFGFFAYATYDLTNLATLRDWPLSVSLMDLAWGTLASGMAALGGRALASAAA
jgi:uncharacterized membrane protein